MSDQKNSFARIGVVEKVGYGFGDTASNLFFQTFNLFLLNYYTDVFGISAAMAGNVLLFTRFVDAFSDPVMGMIADRTKTRFGKFRPYLLWLAVPYGICGYLMFSDPSLSPSGKVIFAFATYTAMMLAYTAINIPYSALLGVISPSTKERTSISTYRFVLAFGGGLIVTSTVVQFKDFLGGGNSALGYKLTMAIFAVLAIAMFWFTFFSTRERVAVPEDAKVSLKRDIGFLLKNRPWLILFFGALFSLSNVGVRNAMIVYYMKYYVGVGSQHVFLWMGQTSLFMTEGMVFLIVGVAITPLLSKRWGKRQLMIGLSTLNALAMAAFFFLKPNQLIGMHALNIFASIVAGPTVPLIWAMYADTADYGEWKFKRRTTGLIFAAVLFAQKAGLGIGGWFAGHSLAYFGFVANQVQSARSLFGICFVFAVVPGIFALLNVVALYLYPLKDDTVLEMERELQERKGEVSTVA